MPPKLRHECERCGLAAEFERAGRFRDEDYTELLQAYFELERRFIIAQGVIDSDQRLLSKQRQEVRALLNPTPPSECPF